MRRSRLLRAAAALLAATFAVAALDPPALHPCPMHDRVPAGMSMPGMDAHLASSAAPAPGRAHVHGCTCLGACAAGALALASPVGVRPLLALPAFAWGGPTAAAHLPGRPAPEHLLPFAHAPPAIADAA